MVVIKRYMFTGIFLMLWGIMLSPAHRLAAQNPAAGKPQEKRVALVGATVHTAAGQVFENGIIVFDQGIITAVGDARTVYDRQNTEVIDVSGKHIFPGAIAIGTMVGLQEIASVRATLDYQEVGDLNPNARALIAYDTDSEVIPTLRSSGLLLVQATPQGGLISGTSSVMHTDGWNWEDAVLRRDDGIWLNWPAYVSGSLSLPDLSTSLKRNERRQGIINELHTFFSDARAYREIPYPDPVNVRLEAMKGLFDGSKNLYVRAELAKDMVEAVKFARSYGVSRVVVVGGREAFRIAAFLKENDVPVVLNKLHRLPDHQDSHVFEPYELPGLLLKAGVTVALSHGNDSWRVRNLNYQAGTAAAFSDLSGEEALRLVSLYPARVLGVDRWVGSLEKGKHATLVVTGGDMLDMRFNTVELAFIKGAKVNLDDKQKRLYRKYKEKYGQE